MRTKTYRGAIELKRDGRGEFRAVFSTLNVIDKDGDVTLPGAFQEGQKVRIAYWGHRWQDLPVGRGEIHSDQTKAWVDGRFFLDTQASEETYQTVKNLSPDLQEWSYGFEVLESEPGTFGGQRVTFLKKLDVFEVSPVLLGAGITRTEAIKGFGFNPSVGQMRAQIAALDPMSPAAVRAQLRAMDPPGVRAARNRIDQMQTQILDLEYAVISEKLAKSINGRSRLEVMRDRLREEGHNPDLVEVMLEADLWDRARQAHRDRHYQTLAAAITAVRRWADSPAQ